MILRVSLRIFRTFRFAKRVLCDFFFRNNGLLLASAVA